MTGQHGRRGSGRHHRGSHGPSHDPEPSWRPAVEVEDIETRGLAPSRRPGGPPLGVQGMVAAVALVGLLALGLGAMGGRGGAGASAGSSAAAAAGTSGPAGASTSGALATSGPTPLVTPWTACSPPGDDVPAVYLEVDGRKTELDTVVAWQKDGPSFAPRPGGRGQSLVVVPSDVHTELWIEGGDCASAWTITAHGEILAAVTNVALDPALAAQNRFELQLAPFAGREVVLGARLYFPHLILDVAQPIRVEPFGFPEARLTADRVVEPVAGCDVVVTLGNGYETDRGCDEDLPFPPEGVLGVDPGAWVAFDLPGWTFMGATVTCGRLSGLAFVAEPEPGCFAELDVDPAVPGVGFTPDFEGGWTLAISACALEAERSANRVCGTWFADVRVEG